MRLVDWDNERSGILFATASTFFAPDTDVEDIYKELVLLVTFLADVSNTLPPPRCYRSVESGPLDKSRAMLKHFTITTIAWAGPTCVFVSGRK